jgi:hypothetical protein
MPKYYCQNSNYKTILQADDIKSAMRKMLSRMMNKEIDCAILTMVGERGFYIDSAKPVSMIPFMREMDVDLPSDEILINEICKFMNLNPNVLPQKTREWLLYGEGENNGSFGY